MFKSISYRQLGVAVLCLLSGCATFGQQTEHGKQQAETDGAVMVVTVRQQGARAMRLRLVWQRKIGDAEIHDTVDIKGILGNTIARFQVTDSPQLLGGVSVVIDGLNAQQKFEAQRILAKLPPPQTLGYWLFDAPADAEKTDAEVTAAPKTHAVQHGWEVFYNRYDDDGRPAHITLRPLRSNTSVPQGKVDVQITQWLSRP